MKIFKKILLIALTLFMVLGISSCATKEEDAQIKAQCVTFIDALIANDPDSAYAVVSEGVISREDFSSVFDGMRKYISEGATYELTQTGWSTGKSGGATTTTSTFEMRTQDHTYKVVASVKEGTDGLAGFQILILDPDKTGTITTMGDANALQWIVLVIAILETAFVIWMFVDCCRQKMQRKAIWLIFILIGMLSFSYTWSDAGTNASFTVGFILNYSMLAKYETGATVLRLLIPLGAILYAIMRKNLIAPQDIDSKPQTQSIETTSEPCEQSTPQIEARQDMAQEKNEPQSPSEASDE